MRRLAPTVLLALVLAAGAHAYSVDGRAWPRGEIRYYNAAADQAWAVRHAVAAWNESGARVRLVPAPESRAQLVIRELPQSDCAPRDRSLAGEATVGYARGATVWISTLDVASRTCGSGTPSYAIAAQPDRCATAPGDARRYRWSVDPGGTEESGVDGLGAGTYCVSVWTVDPLGRPSDRAATAWIRMV